MPKTERLYKNEQLAKKPSFEGNREILRTIFQPRALSSDIPASRKEVYLFYNPPNNFSARTHLDPSCIFCGFFRFPWYGIFNQLFNFSLSGFCKTIFCLLFCLCFRVLFNSMTESAKCSWSWSLGWIAIFLVRTIVSLSFPNIIQMEGPNVWIEDLFSFSQLQHWQVPHTKPDFLDFASSVWTAWTIEQQLGLGSYHGKPGLSGGKSFFRLCNGQM